MQKKHNVQHKTGTGSDCIRKNKNKLSINPRQIGKPSRKTNRQTGTQLHKSRHKETYKQREEKKNRHTASYKKGEISGLRKKCLKTTIYRKIVKKNTRAK